MLTFVIIFTVLLIILFFISRALINNLFRLFLLLGCSQQLAIQLLTWFLIPGTIIHELSHLLIAEILRVRTGKISFTPEVLEEGQIKAGGVQMVKSDPLRQAIIGLAPTVVGISLIYLITYKFLSPIILNIQAVSLNQVALLFFIFYLLFILSNTMFSSKKDLETILFPIILIAVIGFLIYFAGITIGLKPKTITFLNTSFQSLSISLAGVIIIDLCLFLGLRLIIRLNKRSFS